MKVIGTELQRETMERDVDRVLRSLFSAIVLVSSTTTDYTISIKEKETVKVEEQFNSANANARQVEASIMALQNQIKGKQRELKGERACNVSRTKGFIFRSKDLDAQIAARLTDSDKDTIQDAIREAEEELELRRA